MQNRSELFTKKKIIMTAVSFIVMTAVYLYLAREYPPMQRIKSAVGHSLFCFFMTFFAIFMMNFFYKKVKHFKHAYMAVVALSSSTGLGLMTVLHLVLGTPDLLETLIGSSVMGSPMFLLYPYKVVKSGKKLTN